MHNNATLDVLHYESTTMAKDTASSRSKRTNGAEQPSLFVRLFRSFSAIERETARGIGGVFLIVLTLLLILSPLHMAGVLGNRAYQGLFWFFGIGYYVLPPLFAYWAFSLFAIHHDEDARTPVRNTGLVLFFFSLLGTIGVLAETYAGAVGRTVAHPLLTYLDQVATLVILAGLITISFLLVFESALLVALFKRATSHLRRDTVPVNSSSPVTPPPASPLTAPEEAVSEVRGGIPNSTYDDTDEDEDTDDEDLAYTPPPPAPPPKKRSVRVVDLLSTYTPPPLDLLEPDRNKALAGNTKARANTIQQTFRHFNIAVEMDEIVVGPTVTRFALKPAEGVKLSRIVSLQQNIELALAASPIRIEAPIPGRSLVGIEVPNQSRSTIGLGGLLSSPEFTDEEAPLFVALGKDITGSAHYANMGKMPHLLVAGTTGSGKSVMIHSLITSLLYHNSPDRLRLIMVDPKRVELTLYDGIPHLLMPVIMDAKRCIQALTWAVKEMERRYDTLQKHKLQDLTSYHRTVVEPAYAELAKRGVHESDAIDPADAPPERLPHIVIFIDELADIMSAYPRELEAVIVKLAQKSRAVGIHLVLSTQRPEVKVITGLIKANIPTRIALKVNNMTDSRTIIDQNGADRLLGAGDLLYLSSDMSKPKRLQSPFVTTDEIKNVAAHLIKHNPPTLGIILEAPDDETDDRDRGGNDDGEDALYDEVLEFVLQRGFASTSQLQRRFRVGYGRAARIMDYLEQNGVIQPSDGSNKPRQVDPRYLASRPGNAEADPDAVMNEGA